MTNYIILSPTIAKAIGTYDYAVEKLGGMVVKHSRRQHAIETKDTFLRFMSEEQCAKGVLSGTRGELLNDTYFEKMLDEYLLELDRIVHIGDVVEFNPFNGIRPVGFSSHEVSDSLVKGTVVYVNRDHRWFTAEYVLGDTKLRSSFKFTDIEDSRRTVVIVKRKGEKV